MTDWDYIQNSTEIEIEKKGKELRAYSHFTSTLKIGGKKLTESDSPSDYILQNFKVQSKKVRKHYCL